MRKVLENFRPATLAKQAAQSLRESILRGELRNPLPGEIQLAEKLQISRPTIRSALATLAKEGLIVTAKGKRSRIVERPASWTGTPRQRVLMVCPHPKHSSMINAPILQEIRFQLTSQGIECDELYDAKLASRNPGKILKEVVSSYRNACYLLILGSSALHAWFQSSGEPCLVLGSCHPEVKLPSLDIDHRAIGWHATGQMVKEGHRRLLLVLPAVSAMGDRATEEGMRAYLKTIPNREISLQTVQARAGQQEFRVALQRLICRKDAPTACLATRVEYALSLIGCLPLFGKSVPKDLSVIASHDNPIFQSMLPEMARYVLDYRAQARRAMRAIHHLLEGVPVRPEPSLLMPHFQRGQTLTAVAP